jgi:acyl transferase domain-containing protein
MTAKEVSGIDPMQRQLLEVAYEAFENGELLQKIITENLPFCIKMIEVD